ncbi:hypothetical protein [Lysobacter terrae]
MNSPYEPPASRPSNGGIARPARSPLWRGFGWGWAAIAFTFLWTGVAFPLFSRFISMGGSMGGGFLEGVLWLVLLFAPTLALMAYFARRREWRAVLGVVLAWASGIALVLLLVAACLGIMGAGRFAG